MVRHPRRGIVRGLGGGHLQNYTFMKYSSPFEANKALEIAGAFAQETSTGRLIIYAEHTDKIGLNLRFWLCFQPRIDAPCKFSIEDQVYLDRDGGWRKPHGDSSRRHFSTPSAAIKHAKTLFKLNYSAIKL
jgi:hypothetical protein